MFPWAAAIGAGASLLGGLFTNKSNKKNVDQTAQYNLQAARETNAMQQGFFDQNMSFQREQFARTQSDNDRAFQYAKRQNRIDRTRQNQYAKQSTGWQFKDLMQAADSSGIHRLAALGGASSYQSVPGQSVPTPSGYSGGSTPPSLATPQTETAFMGDIIGPAIAQFQNSYQNQLMRERNATQDKITKAAAAAEIRNLETQSTLNIARSRSLLAEARKTDEPAVQLSKPSRSTAPVPVVKNDRSVATPDTVQGYRLFGYDVEPSPRSDDAEVIEQRGGEGTGLLAGIGVTLDDLDHNTLRPLRDKLAKKFKTSPNNPKVKKLAEEIKEELKKANRPRKSRKYQHPNPHFRR